MKIKAKFALWSVLILLSVAACLGTPLGKEGQESTGGGATGNGACKNPPNDCDGDGQTAQPPGSTKGDCDDSDPSVNEAAEEVCGNGKDDDCDESIDEPDCVPAADGGMGGSSGSGGSGGNPACTAGDLCVGCGTCVEYCRCFNNPQAYCQSVCNGQGGSGGSSGSGGTPSGGGSSGFGGNAGSGGAGGCPNDWDCDSWVNASDNCPWTSNPGQEDLDKDGQGDACDPDKDGDQTPALYDCNDWDATVAPFMPELCDGKDNQCPGFPGAGLIDEGCASGTGGIGGSSGGPSQGCANDLDCDTIVDWVDNCPQVYNPPQTNLDNDAYGDACDDDADGDGHLRTVNDCDDMNKFVYVGAPEICGDGRDNDCDGVIDEGCGGNPNPNPPSGNGYAEITYTYTSPGAIPYGVVEIFHEAKDAAGNILNRTPPYGPCGTTSSTGAFGWSVAWDCNANRCEALNKNTIQCTVHVPASSVVRANPHYYNQGAMYWACAAASGPVNGTLFIRDRFGKPIDYAIESWPQPGGTPACRVRFTAPFS